MPAETVRLLEAAAFMDANECRTLISAARSTAGLTTEQALSRLDEACDAFDRAAGEKFRRGESVQPRREP